MSIDDATGYDARQQDIKDNPTDDEDTWNPECPRCGCGLIPDEYEDGDGRMICDNYCGYWLYAD